MPDRKDQILLNGDSRVNAALVKKAGDLTAQPLGNGPVKTGVASLWVAKSTAGKPCVAVLTGGKHRTLTPLVSGAAAHRGAR